MSLKPGAFVASSPRRSSRPRSVRSRYGFSGAASSFAGDVADEGAVA